MKVELAKKAGLAKILKCDYDGENLVFLVGCSRSGTTWLQRLISSHPKIKTGHESHLFSFYIGPLLRNWRKELNRENDPQKSSGRGYLGLSCYFSDEEFIAILRSYLINLLNPMVEGLRDGELFLEKTPQHALYVREIKELLPACRIIHIIRDPRDVVASLLAASKSWGAGWAPRIAYNAARFWVRHIDAIKDAKPFLSPSDFYELRYEDLFQNPSEILVELSRFLNIEWKKTEINNSVKLNSIESAKRGNATRIPLRGEARLRNGDFVKEPEQFIRCGEPAAWKKDLSIWEKLQVYLAAGKVMRDLGYKW